MGTLYVVSTPVGNLDDHTVRSARVLAEVDCVLAEDTRHTGRLLAHLQIDCPLLSLHRLNEASRVEEVLRRLEGTGSLALVSDAGTPLVSDPGERLVDAVLDGGHRVVPIPGASAVLAALVASGFPAVPFTFLGFVPRKGRDRSAVLDRVAGARETTVIFEAPGRTVALLEALADRCSTGRRASIGRELTKLHEDVRRGTLPELVSYYSEAPPRGEVTLVVEPASGDEASPEADEAAVEALARALLAEGVSPSRAARQVARRLGLPRNQVYDMVQDLT